MKWKRPLAIAALVLLLLLYISTIVFAVLDIPNARQLLMASLYCTIALPIFLYAYQLWFRHVKDKKDKS